VNPSLLLHFGIFSRFSSFFVISGENIMAVMHHSVSHLPALVSTVFFFRPHLCVRIFQINKSKSYKRIEPQPEKQVSSGKNLPPSPV
jgi:hypothetical protein